MANTKKYLSHLLQNTGITPACSEEERAAADVIAKIFSDHGFAPEVQEFSASGSAKVVQAALGILLFAGAVLAGIGGAVGVVGLLIAIAAAVIFVMERSGRPVLSNLGSGGLSQNVIAYHKASGPLASPRNRPVVVVAHYDSPRADLLSTEPFAAYRPLIVKLLPYCMVAPAVLVLARMLPVPDPAKIVLWILAIVAALVPLANGIAIIANRFFLPYTTGSVCNKSSVAAMLGVMDAVAPYEMGEEFPSDQPADEYFAEQQRILEEAIAAAEAAAAAEASYPHEMEESEQEANDAEGAEPASEEADAEGLVEEVVDFDSTSAMSAEELAAGMVASGLSADDIEHESALAHDDALESGVMPDVAVDDRLAEQGTAVFEIVQSDNTEVVSGEPVAVEGDVEEASHEEEDRVQSELDFESAEPEPPFRVNAEGNVRFGADVIRSLGMMPEGCAFVYEPDAPAASAVAPAEFIAEDVAAVESVDDAEDIAEGEALEFVAEIDEDPIVEEEAYGDYVEVDSIDDDMDEDDEAFAAPLAPEDEEASYILEAEYEVIEDEPLNDESSEDEVPTDRDLPVGDAEDEPIVGKTIGFDATEGVEGDPADQNEPDAPSPRSTDEHDEADGDALERASEAVAPSETEDARDGQGEFVLSAPNGSSREGSEDSESTQMFSMPADESPVDLSGTVAMPVQRVETVDSLMAEIDRAVPARPQRVIDVPSTAAAPKPRTPETANRASLFDLPDPSAVPVDPFAVPASAMPSPPSPAPVRDDEAAEARSAFTVISSPMPVEQGYAPDDVFETISAPAPAPEKPRRGLGRLFGRKKKTEDSMSDWLGVDDSFDAKRSGHDIGSWDNFDDDDWKGGAAPFEGATEEELREAIADMGDDELLGHDIWFVATGASENGNAGMQAFLDAHRDKLRGVFLINLESIGAGQVAMLSTEGEQRVLKGDKRITKLVQHVSSDFHHEYPTVDMPYVTTDANVAMNMSLRSLTIAGVEGTGFALARTEEDQPYNVDLENVAVVSDVVTEVIRRS